MSEKPPPLYRPQRRQSYEPQRIGGASNVRRVGGVVYAILALLLAGVAVYMAVIERHPLASPYVAAPAVGAAWFALRLFMTMAPRG